MFLRVRYPDDGEEKVDLDVALSRLHRQADPLNFLDSLMLEGHAAVRLNDGRIVHATPWREADDEPKQLNLPAVIPIERTYELDVALEISANTRAYVRAGSPTEAEGVFRDWLAGDRSPDTCQLDVPSLTASLRDNYEFSLKNHGWGDMDWRIKNVTQVPLALEDHR